jgi:sugar lactone lactonase YvrE
VQVNITPALADPIPVSISGVPATIGAGTSITATASVSDGTTGVVYVWYLNGVSAGTGTSFTFGSALAAGYYRLDLTAYTATRAGSATANFQITSAQGAMITTVVGNGIAGYSGDGGPAAAAQIDYATHVAFDSSGNLYVADWLNHRIRKVTPAGIISTIAGNGTSGYAGDGRQAVAAQLNFPSGIAVDSAGNVFVADSGNVRIRRIDPAGTISTVAGNGGSGNVRDGDQATSGSIGAPIAVAIDSSNNLYFSDVAGCVVRKVTPEGIISTVAGNGTQGFSGDGGPATSAQLGRPMDISIDPLGRLLISDTWNNCIRRVNPDGQITTIAGVGPHLTGSANNGPIGSFSGDDGPATLAALYFPIGLVEDSAGTVYFSDWGNRRIRKISPSGTISTIAGTGVMGYSGDGGPAILAKLSGAYGIAMDSSGRLYLADYGNSRVRKIQ